MDKAANASNLSAHDIKHGFFGRHGGASSSPYNSLNVSFAVGDNPARVHQNLDEVATSSGIASSNLCLVKQTHSTKVLSISSPTDRENRVEADAIVTATAGLAIGIQTADCGPVLFADPVNRVIGGCHAGWKGAVGGIVGNTIDAMIELGAERKSIVAALGPSICVQNYEVGEQFQNSVLTDHPHAASYFKFPDERTKAHFDLPHCIMDQLESANIADFVDLGICTYQNSLDYFSHRQATHLGEKTGRQLSVIALL